MAHVSMFVLVDAGREAQPGHRSHGPGGDTSLGSWGAPPEGPAAALAPHGLQG